MIRISQRTIDDYDWIILEKEEDVKLITNDDYNIVIPEIIYDIVDITFLPQYPFTTLWICKDIYKVIKNILSGNAVGGVSRNIIKETKENGLL